MSDYSKLEILSARGNKEIIHNRSVELGMEYRFAISSIGYNSAINHEAQPLANDYENYAPQTEPRVITQDTPPANASNLDILKITEELDEIYREES